MKKFQRLRHKRPSNQKYCETSSISELETFLNIKWQYRRGEAWNWIKFSKDTNIKRIKQRNVAASEWNNNNALICPFKKLKGQGCTVLEFQKHFFQHDSHVSCCEHVRWGTLLLEQPEKGIFYHSWNQHDVRETFRKHKAHNAFSFEVPEDS